MRRSRDRPVPLPWEFWPPEEANRIWSTHWCAASAGFGTCSKVQWNLAMENLPLNHFISGTSSRNCGTRGLSISLHVQVWVPESSLNLHLTFLCPSLGPTHDVGHMFTDVHRCSQTSSVFTSSLPRKSKKRTANQCEDSVQILSFCGGQVSFDHVTFDSVMRTVPSSPWLSKLTEPRSVKT